MRRAIRLKTEYVPKDEADFTNQKRIIDDGPVIFHAFGVDYEDFEAGPGNFSTAIVEHPDGTVESVSVNMIRFDPPSEVSP